MMDSGILPGVYNHIVIAVHFQKINSVCVCVCVVEVSSKRNVNIQKHGATVSPLKLPNHRKAIARRHTPEPCPSSWIPTDSEAPEGHALTQDAMALALLFQRLKNKDVQGFHVWDMTFYDWVPCQSMIHSDAFPMSCRSHGGSLGRGSRPELTRQHDDLNEISMICEL